MTNLISISGILWHGEYAIGVVNFIDGIFSIHDGVRIFNERPPIEIPIPKPMLRAIRRADNPYTKSVKIDELYDFLYTVCKLRGIELPGGYYE